MIALRMTHQVTPDGRTPRTVRAEDGRSGCGATHSTQNRRGGQNGWHQHEDADSMDERAGVPEGVPGGPLASFQSMCSTSRMSLTAWGRMSWRAIFGITATKSATQGTDPRHRWPANRTGPVHGAGSRTDSRAARHRQLQSFHRVSKEPTPIIPDVARFLKTSTP